MGCTPLSLAASRIISRFAFTTAIGSCYRMNRNSPSIAISAHKLVVSEISYWRGMRADRLFFQPYEIPATDNRTRFVGRSTSESDQAFYTAWICYFPISENVIPVGSIDVCPALEHSRSCYSLFFDISSSLEMILFCHFVSAAPYPICSHSSLPWGLTSQF
jgi:hypothetical protein